MAEWTVIRSWTVDADSATSAIALTAGQPHDGVEASRVPGLDIVPREFHRRMSQAFLRRSVLAAAEGDIEKVEILNALAQAADEEAERDSEAGNTEVAQRYKDLIVRLRTAAGWVERQDTPAPDWDALLIEAADAIQTLEIQRLLRDAVETAGEIIQLAVTTAEDDARS